MKQEIIPIDLNGVNCYLGKSDDGFVLFDTGGYLLFDKEFTNRREKLTKCLEEAGCRPGNLKAIILTHGDVDHVANAAFLREKYQTVVAIHEGDLELVDCLTLEKMMETFHYRSVIYRIIFRFMKGKIIKISEKTIQLFESFRPDVILKDGDDLTKYGFRAKVIHLPGHTAGSVGILCEGGDLISGDIFANMKKPEPAPNAVDFSLMKESINKLKTMNLRTFYPGHGKPFQASELV